MKTTQEWLTEVKSSPEKLTHWLERQYIGEALAAERIAKLAEQAQGKAKTLLLKIAQDEQKHRDWVGSLLTARNMDLPVVSYKEDRYWGEVLPNAENFDEITAAGHHAEAMRLVRIRALAADTDIDEDIRNVFSNILPDEEMHAKGFEAISTPEAIESMRGHHERGLEMLGLTI